MPLLYLDGCEHYSDVTTRYVSGNIIPTQFTGGVTAGSIGTGKDGGRAITSVYNGSAYLFNNTFIKFFSEIYTTLYIGFAIKYSGYDLLNHTAPGVRLLSFFNTQESSVPLETSRIMLKSNGGVEFWNSSTGVVFTTDNVILPPSNRWNYVECKVVFTSGSTGSFVMKVNEQELINVSGIRTLGIYNNVRAVGFGFLNGSLDGTSYKTSIDDIYIKTDGYLGEVYVKTLAASASGSTITYIPTGGTINYQQVDDPQHDGDSTYVWSQTPGDIDLYRLTSLPSSSISVLGTQHFFYGRTDGVSGLTTPVIRPTVSNTLGSTRVLESSYREVWLNVWETNPDTATAWTIDEVNSTQVGIRNE